MTQVEIGLRVVRGPDWKWGDQDGGEGHVGTVVKIGLPCVHSVQNKAVEVVWDSGEHNQYRVGCENAYHLRVFDNAPLDVHHKHILCDVCRESHITGIRWKCKECYDFDLCTKCYMSDKHDLTHTFWRIDYVGAPRVNVPIRQNAVKIEAKGIFPDATVVRGRNWMWNDQDGTADKKGTVLALKSWDQDIERSGVAVIWNPITELNVYRYRVGFHGEVDLQYTEAAVWGNYYKDHLPIVGKIESGCDTGDCCRINQSVQYSIESTRSTSTLQEINITSSSNTFTNSSTTTEATPQVSVHSQTADDSLVTINSNTLLEDLSLDLLKLYECHSSPDCFLNAQGTKIPAHRIILSARSTVFEAMFRPHTLESETGHVDMPDIQPTTLNNILHFVYAGKIQDLTEETAASMLSAANKYALHPLRSACLDFLLHNLTVRNICDAAIQAHDLCEEYLYLEVIKFVKLNLAEIKNTQKWKFFKKNHLELLNDILEQTIML